MSLGIAQLMRKAAPVIQMASASSGDSNLDLLRRLATSKISNPPPSGYSKGWMGNLDPPVDPGMTPPRSNLIPQNPDIGFERPPSAAPAAPALNYSPASALTPATTSTDVPTSSITMRSTKPYVGAPDMSLVDPEMARKVAAGLANRPAGELSTASDSLPESSLTMRAKQPVDYGAQSVGGLVYDRHGRPLKPEYLNPTTDAALQGREEYTQALQSYKAENHNSRGVSALLGAGRGALAGLRYGIGGAIGGAIEGGVHGAVHPALDEEYAKARDLGEVQQETAANLDFRHKQSALQNEETDRAYKNAQTQRALNPRYKPDVITLGNGDVVSVEDGTATPILNQKTKQPIKGKVTANYEWRNDPYSGKAELWERTPGETDKKIVGAVDAKKDLIWSKMGWVPAATALMADATGENRDYQRGRNTQLDIRHDTERTQDIGLRQSDKEQARREKAAGIASEVAAINAKAGEYQDLATRTPDTAKDVNGQLLKPYYQSLAASKKQEGIAKAKELTEGYSDIYEAGPGQDGWAYAKPKPAAAQSQLSSTPPSSKPGAIQANEDPNVRAYANQYFKGDYAAAQRAIQSQKK